MQAEGYRKKLAALEEELRLAHEAMREVSRGKPTKSRLAFHPSGHRTAAVL